MRYFLLVCVPTLAPDPVAWKDPRMWAGLATVRDTLDAGHLTVEAPHRAWKDLPFGVKAARHVALDAGWAEIVAAVR